MTSNSFMTSLAAVLLAASSFASELTCWYGELPRPIFDEKPELVDFYYKAWDLAHSRIDEVPGLPAPRYMDEAHRSDRIWIWDTCFMVHFCKYCPDEFPGIASLENFYGVMLADKAMPLPKAKGNRWCGADEGKMLDFKIHHPDNPPLFAWTEYVYALQTGDRARLEKVYLKERYLQRWYEMFDRFDPAGPKPHGSVMPVKIKKFDDGFSWSGCASGMDNTPRGRIGEDDSGPDGKCPDNPDLLWVDALAQQGLSALYLSRIAQLLGRTDESKEWMAKYEEIKIKINTLYWDEADGFYYDILKSNRAKVKVMTPASFWPVLAEMSSSAQMERMASRLTEDKTLGGALPTVSLSRSDADFRTDGGYWRGAMWLPTTYMTVKALDQYGKSDLARQVARKVVEHMYKTYVEYEPHTIWECYSPTEAKPAITPKSGKIVRSDFCGWSALGPISLFIEDVIGIKSANAFTKTLVCDFPDKIKGRVGVENYRFGDIVCSVIATKEKVVVKTNLPFTLILSGRRHQVKEGESEIVRWFDAELNYIGPSDRGPVGGVSLIGYADGRRHFTSWGWADEEKKMKFSADTMCWIASNTKGIAAAAVLTLIDDGLVSLDDPISKYLPEFADLTVREKDGSVRPAKTVMTLRHVLSHTSGLAFFPGKPCDRRDERPMRLLAHLGAKTPLEFDPGEGFKYSNWGIDVAVAVIEAVTGRPWEERLKNRILQPLEMSDTTFWPDEEQMRRMAKGYAFKADGRRIESSAYPLRDLCGREPRYAEAGGGLFSTANDLYRFFRMIANNGLGENGCRVLSEKVMREWFSKQTPEAIKKQYSLGMWINPQKNTISHAGAWRTHGFADWKKSTVRLYMVQVVGGNEDTKECGKQWERLSEKL